MEIIQEFRTSPWVGVSWMRIFNLRIDFIRSRVVLTRPIEYFIICLKKEFRYWIRFKIK